MTVGSAKSRTISKLQAAQNQLAAEGAESEEALKVQHLLEDLLSRQVSSDKAASHSKELTLAH